MNPDGITYMDISDAYRAGHWIAAINSYRSPAYSWILAPALALTDVKPDAEFAAVHAVNFLIFLVALSCFHFLLTGVIRTHPKPPFPEWAFVGVAYAVFLWSTLTVITLELVTPDLCVAAVVYAVVGLLLRVRRNDDRWMVFFVVGILLGIGYLAKAALLAFAPLMAILCAFAIGKTRQAIPRVMLVALGFAVVSAPWVYALSSAKGRLTFGDAGNSHTGGSCIRYQWCTGMAARREAACRCTRIARFTATRMPMICFTDFRHLSTQLRLFVLGGRNDRAG